MEPTPDIRSLEHVTADGTLRLDVWLGGEIDLTCTHRLDEVARQAKDGSAREVVVHLEQVEYLGSVGIRLLLLLAQLAQQRGGRLVVAQPSEFIRRVLDISGLDGATSAA